MEIQSAGAGTRVRTEALVLTIANIFVEWPSFYEEVAQFWPEF